MIVASHLWPIEIIIEVVLLACANTNVRDVVVTINIRYKCEPSLPCCWGIGLCREPPFLHATNESIGKHGGTRRFGPEVRLVDELVPEAFVVSVLKQALHHLLVTFHDAFVVGSDQVWRLRYSINIPSFFFSFLPDDKIRLSYAASFGISNNDYGHRLTETCKKLLDNFSAVSVREKSAVDLCKKEFGVDAVSVLDPTLLLTKNDYQQLIERDKVKGIPSKPFLLLYILDCNVEKDNVAKKIAKGKGLEIYRIKTSDFGKVGSRHIEDCVYPHISTWLSAFHKADYVVTDSFHGTVFSIIFQKQFLTFANVSRGADRMVSLLDMCDLKFRLYGKHFCDSEINYVEVMRKISVEKAKSLNFLMSNL